VSITTLAGWVANGRPARAATPIADMIATFEGHGFTCFFLPDDKHLHADPPEDHCPFSNTPWPGDQPYPLILALDLMPHIEGDGKSLAPIARAIIADKEAGLAPWIKYMNWTDEHGDVHHTKWQPHESTGHSGDSGHIHISIRTDFATSTAARGWDPITGGAMTDAIVEALMNRTINGRRVADILGAEDGTNRSLGARFDAIDTALTAIRHAVTPAPQLDVAQLATQIADRLVASGANRLTATDHAGIVEDVKAALHANPA
jgi:hypothetical protein